MLWQWPMLQRFCSCAAVVVAIATVLAVFLWLYLCAAATSSDPCSCIAARTCHCFSVSFRKCMHRELQYTGGITHPRTASLPQCAPWGAQHCYDEPRARWGMHWWGPLMAMAAFGDLRSTMGTGSGHASCLSAPTVWLHICKASVVTSGCSAVGADICCTDRLATYLYSQLLPATVRLVSISTCTYLAVSWLLCPLLGCLITSQSCLQIGASVVGCCMVASGLHLVDWLGAAATACSAYSHGQGGPGGR